MQYLKQFRQTSIEDYVESNSPMNQNNTSAKNYIKNYYQQFGGAKKKSASTNQDIDQRQQNPSQFQQHIKQQLISMNINLFDQKEHNAETTDTESRVNKNVTTIGGGQISSNQNVLSQNLKQRAQKRQNNYNKLIEVLLCPTERLISQADDQGSKLSQNKRKNHQTIDTVNDNKLNEVSPQQMILPKLISKNGNQYNEGGNLQQVRSSSNNNQGYTSTQERVSTLNHKESFINMLRTLDHDQNDNNQILLGNATLQTNQTLEQD
ncbi:UNKNOWN [Stylonychia lemnae]|uniref:Uncharacterized protein n=1 Tax=Stylonychia lemnae TaxID=5949 RepID=A0A077ZYC7_STYLE|nr:UNKNOWN [Stylonychia lemnae]|eukprot:CDW73551.1 UNKNOWN [Stylonychia lemnae]